LLGRRFRFTANHLLLLSRMEYRSRVAFVMSEDSMRRDYRPYDFTKAYVSTPGQYCCRVSGRANRADKLYLVIKSVRRITNTRGRPMLWFLLMARESHLCVNRSCAEKTRPPDRGLSAWLTR
jgi:hypothetical protein